MRWLDSISDSMEMHLSQVHDIKKDREPLHAGVHGVKKCQIWLSDWTKTKFKDDFSQYILFFYLLKCILIIKIMVFFFWN